VTIAVLLGVFFLLLVFGVPIAVALGGSVMVASLLFAPINPAIIGQKIFANLDHFTLMAVPFFFLAATVMESGGLVNRLIRFAQSLVGHMRGGLGVTAVLSCMFFAAISGSSPATVAAVGRIMYPALIRHGYTASYAIGALTTAGSLGILIPPSIPLILYGFITETSITQLFIAGIAPGIIYGLGMMVMARLLASRLDEGRLDPESWPERLQHARSAGPALLLPLFIVIGIYGFPEFQFGGLSYGGGAIFTPTEAAVMAVLLALAIGFFLYREMTLRGLAESVVDAGPRVGMIFWIATNAILFGFFITQLGVPDAIAQWLVSMDMPQWLFLLLINLVLIVIGFFLEGVPVILLFMPVLFPAATALGVDPVHFGIVVVVNIELGLVTPPVGLNLFVGSSISDLPVDTVFRACLPWAAVTVLVLGLVTYVPAISLFLPSLMR
jgi:C4-dicarboxylate transporter DctM subunit